MVSDEQENLDHFAVKGPMLKRYTLSTHSKKRYYADSTLETHLQLHYYWKPLAEY